MYFVLSCRKSVQQWKNSYGQQGRAKTILYICLRLNLRLLIIMWFGNSCLFLHSFKISLTIDQVCLIFTSVELFCIIIHFTLSDVLGWNFVTRDFLLGYCIFLYGATWIEDLYNTLGYPFAHLGKNNASLLIFTLKMFILTDLTNIYIPESTTSPI